MLEGLEAVEMKLSEVLVENENFRCDSEYFKKEYLGVIETFKSKKFLVLGQDAVIKGGKRLPLGQSFSDNGVPYIRAEDNKYGFVTHETSPKISEKLSQTLAAYQTKFNDVLITIVGNSIGDIGIVKFWLKKCNLTENCAKVAKLKSLNPNYLLAFLNSTLGILQIKRETVGTAQPKLALERIRKFKIPIASNEFQTQIENIVKTAHDKLQESKTLYTEAENLLLQELGLIDFKPSTENIAIKKFSESFRTTGRLDAEYYQPKYEEILEKVKRTRYDILGDIVTIKKSIEPGSNAYQDEGIPFVRIADLSKDGISHSEIYLNPASFDTKKLNDLYPKKDTILLSKDGTVGIAYTIKTESNIITSGALLHLKIRKNNTLPEYLTLVLNSVVVKMQSDRDVGGSIIKHWIPSEIEKVFIPLIDLNLQQRIESKIQQSFVLKKESKHLLSIAKQAVEIAIEQNEEIAIKWFSLMAVFFQDVDD